MSLISLIIPLLIGILSIIVPGFFLALALLKKTGMPMFEIAVIGFIFGLIFPPTLIWLESFLMQHIHFFTFSNTLYNLNVIFLTAIGIALSFQQGALTPESVRNSPFSGMNFSRFTIKSDLEKDYKKRVTQLRKTITELNADLRMVKEHEKQEQDLMQKHRSELQNLGTIGAEERKKIEESHTEQERRLYEEHELEERSIIKSSSTNTTEAKQAKMTYVWIILSVLMIIAFATRMLSIGTAAKYFEFDPYFDMISTQYILTYGYQLLWDHSAWPSLTNGTIHRLQPLVPYLEAYWYNLAAPGANLAVNTATNASVNASVNASISKISSSSQPGSTTTSALLSNPPNITLLSLVSSWYPPIAAALLVFVVFMFLYHEYGEFEGLLGAGFATTMPILITTFIAGEQLVEPWGIFALFFFYAAYLLAVNNPEEPRYAILAGIAFASNFLGAHYYTVTAGILAGYIILQGVINILRGKDSTAFYKMNVFVIIIISIFFVFYNAYGATLTERTPTILGIPVIVGFPLFSLLGVFVADMLFGRLSKIKDITRINSNSATRYALLGAFALFLITMTVIGYIVIGFLIFMIPIIVLEIVAYPILAMQILKRGSSGTATNLMLGIEILMMLSLLAAAFIFLTPFGKPIFAYIQLSTKFTTPSSPLFMTVQEYEPTGLTYDYGSGGLGLIAASIGGLPILVVFVLIAFSILVMLAIYNRDSQSSILSYAAVWSVAVAGMIEVKYLPHLGVAYIIALCAIFGEIAIFYTSRGNTEIKKMLLYTGVAVFIVLAALPTLYELITAVANPSCTSINNSGNQLGAVLYCNTVQPYWLQAAAWMKANVGPYGPRILSWWDYGDWINWFGNSNAVLRGDNSVATADYAAAAHYVLSSKDGINATELQHYTDSIQAKYILFDDQLVPKWGALDFLACVNINQTSKQYAIAQGKQSGQSYALGTSGCELKHDPAELFIPISQSINNYCQLPGNTTEVALHGFVVVGGSPLNQTYCVPIAPLNNGQSAYLLNNNGTRSNAIIAPGLFGGSTTVQGQQFILFTLLYAPNNANGTITNAPSDFYNSTFYKGFFLGKLPGFTLAYPSNFTGINYVNGTHKVVIFQSNNFTGTLPTVTTKPSWVHNNYTMPG